MNNRKTINLPKYDVSKKSLPNRSDYVGSVAWLKAVQSCLGENVVFALDEALMCQGNFRGRSDEYLVWIYGDDSAAEYNGVVILGNQVSRYYYSHDESLEGISIAPEYQTRFEKLAEEAIDYYRA